jgi:DNA-binding NarL/FixJ family response regulator
VARQADVLLVLAENLAEDKLEAVLGGLSETAVLLVSQMPPLASVFLDGVSVGQFGWVATDTPYLALCASLERLASHQSIPDIRLLAAIASEIQLRKQSVPSDEVGHPLSSREREVAQLVVGGLINQEIASKLGIRVTTVKTHVSSLMQQLQVERRSDVERRQGCGPTSRTGLRPKVRPCAGPRGPMRTE